jgi:hypothetical protein
MFPDVEQRSAADGCKGAHSDPGTQPTSTTRERIGLDQLEPRDRGVVAAAINGDPD